MECDISKMVDESPLSSCTNNDLMASQGQKLLWESSTMQLRSWKNPGEQKHGGWLLRRCGKHFTCVTPSSRPPQLSTKRNPFEYDFSPWRKRSGGYQQRSPVVVGHQHHCGCHSLHSWGLPQPFSVQMASDGAAQSLPQSLHPSQSLHTTPWAPAPQQWKETNGNVNHMKTYISLENGQYISKT